MGNKRETMNEASLREILDYLNLTEEEKAEIIRRKYLKDAKDKAESLEDVGGTAIVTSDDPVTVKPKADEPEVTGYEFEDDIKKSGEELVKDDSARKKLVQAVGLAKEGLKQAVDDNAVKAACVAAAGLAFLCFAAPALLNCVVIVAKALSFFGHPILTAGGLAAGGYAAYEINKGRKGK